MRAGWLFLGVRVRDIHGDFATPVMLYDRAIRPRLRHLNAKTNSKQEASVYRHGRGAEMGGFSASNVAKLIRITRHDC